MNPRVTVAALLDRRAEGIPLPMTLLGGAEGLGREITSPHIQKTGLALAGFDAFLQPGRLLVFGESELQYLESLDPERRMNALAAAFSHDIPAVLITSGWEPPRELLAAAERYHVPLLRTTVATPRAIATVSALLDDILAEREVIHGVLIDILGLGVLLVGDSGIGKSECALDLVVRGHRLVADDAVEVRRRSESVVLGSCPELTRHHMEVRGLGIINVRELFGVASTRSSKRVELVVQLERWEPAVGATQPADGMRAYDRLGLEEETFELLGIRIPLIRMPVAPGRSLAVLVEVAARNQLLRARGRFPARDLVSRIDARLRAASEDDPEHDDLTDGGAE